MDDRHKCMKLQLAFIKGQARLSQVQSEWVVRTQVPVKARGKGQSKKYNQDQDNQV
jgi:hypothetical protein